MAKYIITRTSNNQFRWVLKSSNHETLLVSETYQTNYSARNGIASSKVSTNDSNFLKKTSVANEPYFVQVANNHEPIGVSEMYSSTYARENGIAAVKREAPTASIEDRS